MGKATVRLLADMALFVEVANTRHFARAAAALDIPPSTLSRRIAGLEKDLGVALIRRSTRSFALTEAGALCYERSRRLIAEAALIREALAASSSNITGHIRIGLPLDLAQTIFLPLLSNFVQAHPGTAIEVLSIPGPPNLLREGMDLALVVAHQTRLPDSSQRSQKVGMFSRRLFASRAYLQRRGTPTTPADLRAHDCLLFSAGKLQRHWELRRGRERSRLEVTGVLAANSVGLLASYAQQARGIAMLPDFLAMHAAYGGGLTRVLPAWEAVPAYVFAITPMQLLPSRIRKLVEFLKAGFNQQLAALEIR